jgi:hypothetical protein
LRCPVRNMDITESSRAKVGYGVGYRGIMEGSRLMLGNLVS